MSRISVSSAGRQFSVRRGISLIEALVAMAVMAFGMLGVVGLQATLRANADLSKQRTEATRIAQERIEEWRNFSVLATTAGRRAYADMVGFGPVNATGYTTNTTYSVQGVVTASGVHKTLRVNVSWDDRAGANQSISLVSGLSRVAPELGATAVAPSSGFGGIRDFGRSRGIPPQARNFGDGTSGFRPPQATGGTVAWLFSNTTGLITGVCDNAVTDNSLIITRTDLGVCDQSATFLLIGGLIRFDTGAAPTPTSVLNPTTSPANATIRAQVFQTAPAAFANTTVTCLHGDPAVYYVEFNCAVPLAPSPALARWSGTLRIDTTTLPLSATLADPTAANRKVCRYRELAEYTNVAVPLIDQNLLVIAAGNGTTAYACPTSTTGPTWAHQPNT